MAPNGRRGEAFRSKDPVNRYLLGSFFRERAALESTAGTSSSRGDGDGFSLIDV